MCAIEGLHCAGCGTRITDLDAATYLRDERGLVLATYCPTCAADLPAGP